MARTPAQIKASRRRHIARGKAKGKKPDVYESIRAAAEGIVTAAFAPAIRQGGQDVRDAESEFGNIAAQHQQTRDTNQAAQQFAATAGQGFQHSQQGAGGAANALYGALTAPGQGIQAPMMAQGAKAAEFDPLAAAGQQQLARSAGAAVDLTGDLALANQGHFAAQTNVGEVRNQEIVGRNRQEVGTRKQRLGDLRSERAGKIGEQVTAMVDQFQKFDLARQDLKLDQKKAENDYALGLKEVMARLEEQRAEVNDPLDSYDRGDIDGDGIPNVRDKDVDGDGKPDAPSAPKSDTNGDGKVDGKDAEGSTRGTYKAGRSGREVPVPSRMTRDSIVAKSSNVTSAFSQGKKYKGKVKSQSELRKVLKGTVDAKLIPVAWAAARGDGRIPTSLVPLIRGYVGVEHIPHEIAKRLQLRPGKDSKGRKKK